MSVNPVPFRIVLNEERARTLIFFIEALFENSDEFLGSGYFLPIERQEIIALLEWLRNKHAMWRAKEVAKMYLRGDA